MISGSSSCVNLGRDRKNLVYLSMLPHWRVHWRVNYIYQKESYKSIKQGEPFPSRSFILGGPQTRPLHHRVFYDNEDPEERVIILATGQDLLLLKRSPSRLQAELPNHQGGAPWVFPCVYILLTHKTQDNYLEAFILLNFLLDFSPQVIMSDFEKAIRKSLSQVFLSATVDSSYFHFCQTILRWVRENGLNNAYDLNQ